MTKIYIYSLKDPRNNKVCYIGRSICLNNRFNQHRTDPPSKKFRTWINDLKSNDLIPIMEVIEECNREDANDREIFWINHFDEISLLVNVNRPKLNTEQATITLTKNQMDTLRQMRLDTGLGISSFIRRALDKYLEEVKDDHRTKNHHP